jgi:hypothetical protein
MKLIKKPYAWAVLYALILFLFTAYVTLDTFIIPRTYQIVDSETDESTAQDTNPTETDTDSDSLFTSETVITDSTYSDENVNITITTYRENDTNIYVADIYLASIDDLKTAFAENTYGRNVTQKTSAIAAAHDAILAINGDFYGAQTTGYVIRNGTLYRDTSSDSSQEDLVIDSDGSFEIITEGSVTASELVENGAWQVLSFGPGYWMTAKSR